MEKYENLVLGIGGGARPGEFRIRGGAPARRRRLGGPAIRQRDAARGGQAQSGGPRAESDQAAPAAQPGANPAAAAPKRPWGAMLGGLAAGLGLAWLANSLGLGAAFGQFLMFALLAMVVMVVIGFIMRSRRNAQPNRPLAFQGAGAPADQAMPPRQYSPDNVGNDASARPWERNTMAFDAGKQGQGDAACRSDRPWRDRRHGACPRASTPKASWPRPSATSSPSRTPGTAATSRACAR